MPWYIHLVFLGIFLLSVNLIKDHGRAGQAKGMVAATLMAIATLLSC